MDNNLNVGVALVYLFLNDIDDFKRSLIRCFCKNREDMTKQSFNCG